MLDGGSARHSLKGCDGFWDVVEALLVDCEDRHLGLTEVVRVVQRTDLQNHGVSHARGPGQDMRSAICAEFAGDRVVEITPREFLGMSLGVGESSLWQSNEVVGTAAGHVLTLATMALALEKRVALHLVSQFTAITSAFDFHFDSPWSLVLSPWFLGVGVGGSRVNRSRNRARHGTKCHDGPMLDVATNVQRPAGAFQLEALPVSSIQSSIRLFESR
jgi:hypothetical protein